MTTRAAGDERCGCGASTATRLEQALEEAVAAAVAEMGAETADLGVVFVSAAHGPRIRPVFELLADVVPARHTIGATAEGVLAGGREYESGPAVAVWLARLPGARIEPLALDYQATPDGGMFSGWPSADPWPDHAAVLLVADPFSFPVDAFLTHLQEDHPGVPTVGGMASGGQKPRGNTLALGPRTFDSGAVGVVVGGSIRLRPVVSQGCRPIGRPMVVTKSQDNLIVELGGRPALDRLRDMYGVLSDDERELVRSSLHVGRAASEYHDTFRRGDFLVRNVVGADPDSGVIAVGDLVRTGQTVQFHVRDAATAGEDLRELLATVSPGKPPVGALVFTCNGRGSRLFAEPNHDANAVQECLGPLPVAGFFAHGEIGPIGNRTFLHGLTASIGIFEPA